MAKNYFLKDKEFYQRNIDPLNHYVQQTSFFISKMKGIELIEAKQHVIDNVKKTMVDPQVDYFERGDNGDKFKTQLTLRQYIQQVKTNQEILAPTFTSYLPTHVKSSLYVGFIDVNVALRGVAKKEAFKAQANGQTDLFISKDNEQANVKLYNNSTSGGFVTTSSILHNPTGHNTLTSVTRCVSSLSNASNEKIISGNRHYFNFDATLNNIISITSDFNRELLQDVINKYNIVYPSVQDVIDCIKRSTDFYWRDIGKFIKIISFVEKLTPLERAAFVYTGDLFHLRKHNPEFVRMFLTKLSRKGSEVAIEDSLTVLKTYPEEIVNAAHQICMSECRGKGKDYEKMPSLDVNKLANTVINMNNVIIEYNDFIDAIFLSKHIPSNIAYIPNMVRRSVVLSDTDSTMFSVDEYVNWYFGEIIFTDEAFALATSVMFIATQCMAHGLALFSANAGVSRDKLFKLAMKPEFTFPVFAQTSVAKHYYTCILVKEGNVYDKLVFEHKGVHLKNSASPKAINKLSADKMNGILTDILDGKKISLKKELKMISDLENDITQSLLDGKVEFYKKSKIKNPEAYTKEMNLSPYIHHLFWTDIFASKYGNIDSTPYGVIKIPTIVNNITQVKAWLEGIKDRDIADKLAQWLARYNKTSLPTIYLHDQYVKSYGIPEEIKQVICVKKIVLDLTLTNRMILESLGYFPKQEMLISELGY